MKSTFEFLNKISAEHYNATFGMLNKYKEQANYISSLLKQKINNNKCSPVIVDIGCGTGAIAFQLSRIMKATRYRYFGLDPIKNFIEFASNKEIKLSKFICSSYPDSLEFLPKASMILFCTYLLQSFQQLQHLSKAVEIALRYCDKEDGMVIFSFFDEQIYRKIYKDGPFKIPFESHEWNGEGYTEFDHHANKRIFRLKFTHRKTGKIIGSMAEYLPLTPKILNEILNNICTIRFIEGASFGLETDGSRFWCIAKH
jgi:SAM-dependent methyltransferase